MPVRGRLYGCPVELALTVIGGKWKTVILARLKTEPMRYGELRRAVPELSDKVLTQRLRELVDEGLVERAGEEAGPVRYSLTAKAQSLSPALTSLYNWGEAIALDEGARFRSLDPQQPS